MHWKTKRKATSQAIQAVNRHRSELTAPQRTLLEIVEAEFARWGYTSDGRLNRLRDLAIRSGRDELTK